MFYLLANYSLIWTWRTFRRWKMMLDWEMEGWADWQVWNWDRWYGTGTQYIADT